MSHVLKSLEQTFPVVVWHQRAGCTLGYVAEHGAGSLLKLYHLEAGGVASTLELH
jgi:hypothetical protein